MQFPFPRTLVARFGLHCVRDRAGRSQAQGRFRVVFPSAPPVLRTWALQGTRTTPGPCSTPTRTPSRPRSWRPCCAGTESLCVGYGEILLFLFFALANLEGALVFSCLSHHSRRPARGKTNRADAFARLPAQVQRVVARVPRLPSTPSFSSLRPPQHSATEAPPRGCEARWVGRQTPTTFSRVPRRPLSVH